jgi:hypothetical protein
MNLRRAGGISLALGGAALAAVLGAACVLIEPPGELPPLVPQRPVILHELVVPSAAQILESWPIDGFTVPVQTAGSTSIVWQAFYNNNTHTVGAAPASIKVTDPSGLVTLPGIQLTRPTDPTACVTIEIMVANNFLQDHVPDAVGSDDVTWFYAPGGSLDRCPVFDAGLIDAGFDAGDGPNE